MRQFPSENGNEKTQKTNTFLNFFGENGALGQTLSRLKNTFDAMISGILAKIGIKLDDLKKDINNNAVVQRVEKAGSSLIKTIEKEVPDSFEKVASIGYTLTPAGMAAKTIEFSKKGLQVWNDSDFQKEIQAMSQRLRISPEHLKVVMHKESGINPQARNNSSRATGLIQFMPNTAKNLGTSVDALKNMSALQQLKYVEKFYKPYAGQLKTAGDLYLATFYPYALNKGDNYIIGSEKGEKYAQMVAKQNPGIAKFSNHPKGLITKSAFEKYVYA